MSDSPFRGGFRYLLLVSVLGSAAPLVDSARAMNSLDWDVVDWSTHWANSTGGGNVSQTFTNVDGTGVNMTITITANASTSTGSGNEALNPGGTGSNGTARPDDLNGAPLTNGGNTQALLVDVNYDSITTDFLTFLIEFSVPVSGVSFDIWDIDLGNTILASNYRDVIGNFSANGAAPANLTLTDIGLDVDVFANQLIGVSTNGNTGASGNENDLTSNGTGRVGFGLQQVTSVSFRYSSNIGFGSLLGGPSLQRIALDDIVFVIPEPSSALMLLGAVAALTARRRRS